MFACLQDPGVPVLGLRRRRALLLDLARQLHVQLHRLLRDAAVHDVPRTERLFDATPDQHHAAPGVVGIVPHVPVEVPRFGARGGE